MEFIAGESVSIEEPDTNPQSQSQIDLIPDWKLDRNVECRVRLEKIQNISPEIPPSMESHLKWRTVGSTAVDKRQDETNPTLTMEQAEEFIGHQGNGIKNNSSNPEGDQDIDPRPDLTFPNVNPKPGTQCPVNSEHVQLNEFYLRLLECELDCGICRKYMRQLSEHIKATHTVGQPTCDPLLIDPPEVDQSPAIENKCKVEKDIERKECSEASESDPDSNIESGRESDTDCTTSSVLTRKECLLNSNSSSHSSTHSSGDNRYKCEECGKEFPRKEILTAHKRSHTGKKLLKKRFNCKAHKDCGKGHSAKSLLTIHVRSHTGEKPFKCSECVKSYSHKGSLDYHMRSHTGEKPYKCNLCLKGFSTKAYMTVHMRAHTGDRPFKCDECNKSYSLKCNLDCHKRSHTGEKPFKCDGCDQSYSQKSHLVYHMRSHTGEKPFECPLCLKGFSTNNYLIIHMRRHYGDKQFKCGECNMSFAQRGNLDNHIRSHTLGEVNSVRV